MPEFDYTPQLSVCLSVCHLSIHLHCSKYFRDINLLSSPNSILLQRKNLKFKDIK